MTLLSVKNLSCNQASKLLFENAVFSIEKKDKVAIIGPNGSGKTSLLKMLENAIKHPNENIAVSKGLVMSMLNQVQALNDEHTILKYLNSPHSSAAIAIQDYHAKLKTFNETGTPESEKAFSQASEKMDRLNLWEYEDRVTSILKELDITNLNQKVKDLSGGMRKKIALAQTFFHDVDLLILDEPTNHLDIKTIEWLEETLKRHQSAIIMVTHDRYFLDKLCNKIIEIDQQQVYVYHGGYQCYLEQRAQRYLAQEKQESRIQSILRVELAWLKRGPKARSTKQKARKGRIESIQNRTVKPVPETLDLAVNQRRLGKKVLELKQVSKSFGNQQVLANISYSFQKGDKIGILGPNGAGKTTLLNIIMNKLLPDSGQVDVGVNTVFGYFDQHSQDLDLEASIYEHVHEIGQYITRADGVQVSATKLLETFLFPKSMLKTPIKKLSGGEKRRLHLVCLLLKNPNFLLFDEPTNDFDIQTLSVLEDFLCSFAGVVVIISHDRYFMDRVVERLLVFNGTGTMDTFEGNYTDYAATFQEHKQKIKKPLLIKPINKGKENKQRIQKLEDEIEKLEKEKSLLQAQFTDNNKSCLDFKEIGKRLKELDKSLDKAMEMWEYLLENNDESK